MENMYKKWVYWRFGGEIESIFISFERDRFIFSQASRLVKGSDG